MRFTYGSDQKHEVIAKVQVLNGFIEKKVTKSIAAMCLQSKIVLCPLLPFSVGLLMILVKRERL